MKYIDFNDASLPIGKRKQAYVKWAISKGTDPLKAKIQANKKFGFEKKPGIFAIVKDWGGRMYQASFTEEEDIFGNHNLRKYKRREWVLIDRISKDELDELTKSAKQKGWDVIYVNLYD